MNHKKRGKALIFNHKKFKTRAGSQGAPKERHGTDIDAEALKKTLDSFGFETDLHKDLKKTSIDDFLENLAEEDHKDSDCILVAVLSHGDKDKISAKDEDYA